MKLKNPKINPSLTFELIKFHCEKYNGQFKDKNGKIQWTGSRVVNNSHLQIVRSVIDKIIQKITAERLVYTSSYLLIRDISQPLEVKAFASELKNMMSNMKSSVTVRNYLTRLSEIKINGKPVLEYRNGLIKMNPFSLVWENETGETIILDSEFSTYCKTRNYNKKRKKVTSYKNTYKIKKEKSNLTIENDKEGSQANQIDQLTETGTTLNTNTKTVGHPTEIENFNQNISPAAPISYVSESQTINKNAAYYAKVMFLVLMIRFFGFSIKGKNKTEILKNLQNRSYYPESNLDEMFTKFWHKTKEHYTGATRNSIDILQYEYFNDCITIDDCEERANRIEWAIKSAAANVKRNNINLKWIFPTEYLRNSALMNFRTVYNNWYHKHLKNKEIQNNRQIAKQQLAADEKNKILQTLWVSAIFNNSNKIIEKQRFYDVLLSDIPEKTNAFKEFMNTTKIEEKKEFISKFDFNRLHFETLSKLGLEPANIKQFMNCNKTKKILKVDLLRKQYEYRLRTGTKPPENIWFKDYFYFDGFNLSIKKEHKHSTDRICRSLSIWLNEA